MYNQGSGGSSESDRDAKLHKSLQEAAWAAVIAEPMSDVKAM